jgi:pilus assembly protein CpaC
MTPASRLAVPPPSATPFVSSVIALFLLVVSGTPVRAKPFLAQGQAAAPSSDPGSGVVRGQPITLEAGTGVLVPLSQPATTVLSAEPAIARVQPASPISLFLMGVAPGHTTIIATSENGVAIVQYDVTVIAAAGRASPIFGPDAVPKPAGPAAGAIGPATMVAIENSIRRMVASGTSVTATLAGNQIILSGAVPNAAAGQQAEAIARGFAGDKATVISNFTVLSSIQVNVRVRFAEISRTVERQLGFNWQALGAGNGFRYGALTGAGAIANTTLSGPVLGVGSGIAAAAAGLPSAVLDPRLPIGQGLNQFGVGYSNSRWDLNGVIDALATDQLVTILAEPNLTAQSGEPASFLAGGEFPIPIASNAGSGGGQTITVAFKQFGVSLEVVPTVLSSGRLNLRIKPEVSQLSANGAVSVPTAGGTLTIPALSVRRAETTVELGSGQSFAIAGLLQKNTSDNTRAIPGAGELPVLGALFKSSDFQRGESELVIIVTPYLVKPTSNPAALQLPTDNFRPATDLDRILLGRQLARPDGSALDAGFVLK